MMGIIGDLVALNRLISIYCGDFPWELKLIILKLRCGGHIRLSDINPHPRDKNISFQEEGHIYTIKDADRPIISTTTLIKKYEKNFDSFGVARKIVSSHSYAFGKYAGKTIDEIVKEWDDFGKQESGLGTKMHLLIEKYFNGELTEIPDIKEFKMFLQFWHDWQIMYPSFKPFRTECLIYDDNPNHKLILTGSTDFLLEDDNGNAIIIDWKRYKEVKTENKFDKMLAPFDKMDDCNFSHCGLQLNFYRHVLENIYNKKVIYMMLVVLHPNQETYKCYPIERIDLNNVWDEMLS